HGHESALRQLVRGMVAIDADPVHLSPMLYFVAADDGNVVLRLTRNRAGATADTGVEIDRHAPRIRRIRVFRIQRMLRNPLDLFVLRETGTLGELPQRGRSHL